MVSFVGDVMKATRGDSVYIHLDILTATGKHYIPTEKDEIVFSVRKDANKNSKALITKVFTNTEECKLYISPEDTKYLQPGEYYYDTTITFGEEPFTTETVNNGRFYLVY